MEVEFVGNIIELTFPIAMLVVHRAIGCLVGGFKPTKHINQWTSSSSSRRTLILYIPSPFLE